MSVTSGGITHCNANNCDYGVDTRTAVPGTAHRASLTARLQGVSGRPWCPRRGTFLVTRLSEWATNGTLYDMGDTTHRRKITVGVPHDVPIPPRSTPPT